MTIIRLSKMTIGQSGEIQDLTGDSGLCHRLLEMGITKGTPVEVVRFAPLGDPIDIKLRGYHLSLRRREAENIQVLIKG